MPKQVSTMTPTRKQDAIEIAYEMMYKKRILRRQMLRLKMLKDRKYQNYLIHTQSKRNARLKLTSASSVAAKKTPIILRSAKPVTKPIVKPINIAITFNAKSKNDAEREFRTFAINAVKQDTPIMEEKVRKQWPKLVCSMEIYPITSHDFILNGAVLPSETNCSFFQPTKAPITAPIASSPAPSVSPIGNKLHSTTTVGVDNFPVRKKRRIVLSDCPPPMFKASLKDPYKVKCKLVSFVDLRRKITGSTSELRREKLKMRDDDCISIFAQTDIITDDDLTVNVDIPVIAPIISATKRVEILNWMAQTSSPSTSFNSDTNAPQFSSTSSGSPDTFPDSPDLINNCSSISENTKPHRRFDRFQLSFNSGDNSEQCESSPTESTNVDNVATNENQQHSFKMPYSVYAKSSKVSPSSSSPFDSITANSRNSSDFPSSISEYDSSDCDLSVVIPSVSESQRPEQGVVRSLPALDSPKQTLNGSNCNISPNNQTSTPYFQRNIDIVKSSPIITKKTDNSLNRPISTSNQQKSIRNTSNIWRKYNNNKAQLLNDALIETSNQKSAHVIKANVSNQKTVEQTIKPPENHSLYNMPPPNFIPNELLKTARNIQINNLPSTNQNHFANPPPLFSPNDLMHAENYFIRPPVAIERTPSNGPSIGGQFHLMHPHQILSSNCPQRFPGPQYQRMINVYPTPQIDQMSPCESNILRDPQVRSPNIPPPPTRNFVVQNAQVRLNIGEEQNQSHQKMPIVQNHPLQFPQIQTVLFNFCSWHYREGSCRFGQDCRKYHECPQEIVHSLTLLQPEEIQKIVSKLCVEKLNSVICELLDSFLQVYVRNNNIIAILDLVKPVLEVNFLSSGKLQCILNTLCQLGMNYKNAIIKVLYYVGASNRQLVDILFAIIIDHCDPTTTSTISSNWSAIEQLLESATQLDYGVFSDLCAKSLTEQANNAEQVVIVTALGRVLTAEPCKVNVQRMDQVLLAQLCERLEAIDSGAGLGGLMRSRLLIGWTGIDVMDQDDRIFEDAAISSTIPGPSNTNFISSVPLQIPNSTIAAPAKNKSTATNTERNRNSCSPDSSSFSGKSDTIIANRTSFPARSRPLLSPFSTNPLSTPLLTNKLLNSNRFVNNEQLKNTGSKSKHTKCSSASDRKNSKLCRIDTIERSNSASKNGRNDRENRRSTPKKSVSFTKNRRPFKRDLFSRYSAKNTRDNISQKESGYSTVLPSDNNPSEQFRNCAILRKVALFQQNHAEATLNPIEEINKKSPRFQSTETYKTVASPAKSHTENVSAKRESFSLVSATSLSFSPPKKSKSASTSTKSLMQSDLFNRSVDMMPTSPENFQYSRLDIASHSPTISERILRKNATTNNNNPSTATTIRNALTPTIPPTSPFHTTSIPPASPVTPLPTLSAHFPNEIPDKSIISNHRQSQPPSSISPSSTFYNLTDCHSLYTCIIKYQYNNAASLIAKEQDSTVEPICNMIHSKAVPVTAAFAFFNVLWDHIEHFLQYKELKRVILYILFNIYEFLWKEQYFTDAASLITTKFSNEKESFLYYKTFLPSGQCSPMQKCHRVIKLLLKEKILEPAFDWFIREEYQSTSIASDMNNLANEKNSLIEEFLLLSYRNLDIAFNLVIFCMNRHLGDFKHHYNCILMQMINSTDHKEKILALRERLYNDQYVYINYQTLRSYVVDFFSHLNLNELLHIYDIISRDKVYPKLTGHEHIVPMRDTLKESEISLILMIFLHQIVQNRIVVTWDVKIRFQTEIETGPTMPDGRTGSIVYPRNLLMCSTPVEAVKRLVNVLRSFKYMLPNPADAHKWQACHTSGTVTLYKSHVQAMVIHYRGTQTFT